MRTIIIAAVSLVLGIFAGVMWMVAMGPTSSTTPAETLQQTLETPETPTDATPKLFGDGNIRVKTPSPGDTVNSPLVIQGEANTFENNVLWRVKNLDGRVIANGFTTTEGGSLGTFKEFSVNAAFSGKSGEPGYVELYEESAKDGSELHLVSVPVIFE